MKKKCCISIPAQPPSADDTSLARWANALAHPARVAIVRRLQQRKNCVCGDIADSLPLAQSTVSQHLKILKDAGLIEGQVDGPRVCYCLNREAMKKFKLLLKTLSENDPKATNAK